MAIFERSSHLPRWTPSALAAGPFVGLQGGAVASLLTAEIEAQAGKRKWGTAISASAWFLRPTPMTDLRTELSVVSEGGRVSVIDNTLWPADEDQPCATVRVTLSVLGPADWTHGIARPIQNAVADPNPNLTVQLFRPPSGPWVGVRAQTRWRPAAGLGAGSGVLLDVHGEIGRVSMSVILVPFPTGNPG
jgi:hypothetical protein